MICTTGPAGPLRPRILFVTGHLPAPLRGGSAQRTNLLIEALGSIADVEILAIASSEAGANLETHGYTVAGLIPPDRPRLATRIARVLLPASQRYRAKEDQRAILAALWDSGRYAAVVGRYLGASARAGLHTLPNSFVDIDDLESQKLRSWGQSRPWLRWVRLPLKLLSDRMLNSEGNIITALSGAWVSAADDTHDFEGLNLDVVPNIPFHSGTGAVRSPENGPILFVASFDYRVNRHALIRFVEGVWPAIQMQRRSAKLRIIGGGLDDRMAARIQQIPGVEIAGFVDDLGPEYDACSFSIVPIWEGGGTKIKVLESLAHARTCVVATPSMRGFSQEIRDRHSVIVASDEVALRGGIIELLDDVGLRHRLELQGKSVVAANFSREAMQRAVAHAISAGLSQPRHGRDR